MIFDWGEDWCRCGVGGSVPLGREAEQIFFAACDPCIV